MTSREPWQSIPQGFAMTTEQPYLLSYDGVPPSFNRTRTAHWRKAQRVKKEWQGIFEVLLMQANAPRVNVYEFAEGRSRRFALARAALIFPTYRPRDEGNYRTPIEKSLGDALVNGGWLQDDTPEFFEFTTVDLSHQKGVCRTNVEVGFFEPVREAQEVAN